MSKAVHTAIIDWDGTAVPSCWPAQPKKFNPGFVKNMRRLHKAGIHLRISSARINPWDPITMQRRDPAIIANEVNYIRRMLDDHGLTFIDIWTAEGKAPGSVYVDDKAERYGGRPGSWDKVTDKILMRLGKERAEFPVLEVG